MSESLKSAATIREYLLGRISDEATLEGIEEALFTDADFCAAVELAEDAIINDYVLGHLDNADAESFIATLATNPERRFKLHLTEAIRAKATAGCAAKIADDKPSFLASIHAWLQQPKYVGALAAILIAVVGVAIYLRSSGDNQDALAELRTIYQQGRPTESRISEFGYAPLPQLRGAPEPAAQRRLRQIENNLLASVEENPSAPTHHALGTFYLTQSKVPEAINEFESALKFAGSDARIRNDLGVAHFELSKTGPAGKKLEDIELALEEFTKATKLDPNFLEALFNKSLALQALNLPREARASWTMYLQKDPSSPWANEARKNLERLPSEQTLFKSNEDVLNKFMSAYRKDDDGLTRAIHDETKGLLGGPTVPLQLSRQFLLAQKQANGEAAAEYLDALKQVGNLDQQRYGDSFFFELAGFYADVEPDKTDRLIKAKDLFLEGERASDYSEKIAKFEASRDLFRELGNEREAEIADIWAVQFLRDVGQLNESNKRLNTFVENADRRNFRILAAPAYYSLGMNSYGATRFSESTRNLKTALRLAESSHNVFEIQHAEDALTVTYTLLGEIEPALTYGSRLLAHKALHYQNSAQYWRDRGTLALLAARLGMFSTSLSLSRERLSMIQETLPGSSRVNESLRPVIQASAGLGEFRAALGYAEESMQIALTRPDSPENARTTADVYLLRADLKRQTNDCTAAMDDYHHALQLYRRLPQLTSRLYQIHKGKLFCLEQLNRQDEFDDELKTVLKLSEEYRSTIREDSSRQAYFSDEDEVFDAATNNALASRDSEAAFGYVEEARARSLLDFVGSDKSIAQAEKSFGLVARPLSLSKIQARLPEQVVLLVYSVLSDKLAIWTLSKTQFDLVERPISTDQLEQKILAYQRLIVGKGPPAEIKQAGSELYELLIPPNLPREKQLCIVPDKTLHQLAFNTLTSNSGKYLLEEFALFYAPSASILVLATENARQKERVTNESLLAIGNPEFDHEENPNLGELRDAVTEASTITANYSKQLTLLNADATREKFLAQFGNVEVVHFAGHYVVNAQSPRNSKLLFANGDLRSFELGSFKLPKAKLVVLSACETGFERYSKSEGAIGATRTFLALGAPAVVASQWKVDSETTKDLMIAFHRNRREPGMSSIESLRQAQLQVLRKDITSAPFYWAAFSLFGGYTTY